MDSLSVSSAARVRALSLTFSEFFMKNFIAPDDFA
jgi:hypothetical protein